jgi:hypothetical protein
MVRGVLLGEGVVTGAAVVMSVRAPVPVGAALGAERRLDGTEVGAEAGEHVLDDVVALHDDAIGADLGRGVAVADVPGETRERPGGGAGARSRLEERLGRRLDRDDAAVVEDERVAVVEGDGLGEVDDDREPARGRETAPAEKAVAIVEPDAVHRPRGVAVPHRSRPCSRVRHRHRPSVRWRRH